MSIRRIPSIVVAATAALMMSFACIAGELDREAQFQIAAQPLSAAVIAFSDQSGIQVMTDGENLSKLSTGGVVGRYPIAKALELMLSGTGLFVRPVGNNTVALTRVSSGSSAAMSPGQVQAGVLVAQSTMQKVDASAQSGEGARSADNEAQSQDSKGIPELLVNGKRSLNMDIQRSRDDAQPYVVFQHEDLVKQGATNLEEFFKNNLTSTSIGYSNSQSNSILGSASQIDLGGLGTNQTLILIDGRRLSNIYPNNSPFQPDINGIPLSAIERIEILRSTASGIYGGNATGGVVNIILRRNFSSTEATATLGGTLDGGGANHRFDFSAGNSMNEGKTSLMVSASYAHSDPLFIGQREWLKDYRARAFANSPTNYFLGRTTNIASSDGDMLTFKPDFGGGSVGATTTFVPYGYAGPASDNGAGLITNAGRFNLDLANSGQPTGEFKPLQTRTQVKTLMATLRQDVTGRLNTFLEAQYSENRSAYPAGIAAIQYYLDAAAPGNPFNQSVLVNVPVSGADFDAKTSLQSLRMAGGLIFKMTDHWLTSLDYTWNRMRVRNYPWDGFDQDTATNLMANGTLNVFRDVNAYPINASSAVLPGGNGAVLSNTVLKDLSLRVSGPLPLPFFRTAPTLSALVETRKEKMDGWINVTSYSATYTEITQRPPQSQSTDSAYVELLMPFVLPSDSMNGVDTLELQVAARHDRYKTIGSRGLLLDENFQTTEPTVNISNHFDSTDPTFALRYKPTPDVMLRGSYATGFLAPATNQLVPNATAVPIPASLSPIYGLRDPLRGNELLGSTTGSFDVLFGGSPTLRPERSTSRTAGIVLTPRAIDGLRVSLDWTQIKKRDAVFSLAFNNLLIPTLIEAAPERITRAPATSGLGAITAIDVTSLNLSRSDTEAYDLALDYRFKTSAAGDFTLASHVTKTTHSRTLAAPTSAWVENAGVFSGIGGILKYRATASLQWEKGDWSLSWMSRFYDSYFLNVEHTFSIDQGSTTVPSQVFHDFYASYAPHVAQGSGIISMLTQDVVVRFGVTNLFNTRPVFDATSGNQAYYSQAGDPRLATYFLSLKKTFN